MDEKDKLIAELKSQVSSLAEKNATLEAEKKKKKKRDKTKFALQNLDYFRPILDTIKKQERYVFTRKGKEQVIKINEFISDLLVAKIKLGGSVPDKQIGTRLSMDEHSLIKFLSKDRATKEGAGTKKPKPEAKPIAQPQPAKGGVDAWIEKGGPAVPNFDSMSVDDVFAYVESKVNINPSSEVRQSLIKQLIKHGARDRLDDLRAKIGVSIPNFEKDVASVS
jgi:hypothetical protein